MSDRSRLTIAAVMASLMLGTTANAASLAGIQGRVMVNAGAGYQAVSGSVDLKPGDLVMAGPGSGATLSFEDGCMSAVMPGAVVAIGQQSPCVTQVQAQSQEGMSGQNGGGNTGGTGGTGGPGGGQVGVGGGLGGGLGGLGPALISVGIGVAGATMGIISATNANNNGRPASP